MLEHIDPAALLQRVPRVWWMYLYYIARVALALVLAPSGSAASANAADLDERMIGDERPPAPQVHTITKPLVLWCAAVLPLNSEALNLYFDWVEAHEEQVTRVDRRFRLFGGIPFLLPCLVLAVIWALRKKPFAQRERGHGALRCVLLDGIIAPFFFALWLACRIPEPSSTVLAAAPLYLAQSIVWAYFYLWSKRESYERDAVMMESRFGGLLLFLGY